MMEILSMPEWKSKILNAVAWLLGFRGENAYVITMNIDLNDPEDIKRLKDDSKS